MKRTLSALLLVPALALPWLSGCGTEGLFATTATVVGEVLDTGQNGIFGVNVGVVYAVNAVSGAPRAPIAQAATPAPAAATSGLPYPNPATGESATLRVNVDAPVELSLEVWEQVGGIPSRVRTVFAGHVSADTSVAWDTRDDFAELLPNGMYRVRVTAPLGAADPEVHELPLLINRGDGLMEGLGAFNTASDPDGRYLLTDLAVGKTFTRTASNGSTLGAGLVSTTATLVFRDPDYLPKNEPVVLGPNETLEISTVLTSRFNRPETRAAGSASTTR